VTLGQTSLKVSGFARRVFAILEAVINKLTNIPNILSRLFSKWTSQVKSAKNLSMSDQINSLDDSAEWLEFEEWRIFKGCPALEVDRVALECLGQPVDADDEFFKQFIIINAVVETAEDDETLSRIRVQAVKGCLLRENFVLH
tara:strand:+ start:354 stop:782 length:429 start_codon:yes stop_codon:yes gene_type:complete